MPSETETCFEPHEPEALEVVVTPIDSTLADIHDLKERVARLEKQAALQQPSYFDVIDALKAVKDITTDVFSSPADYVDSEDCEIEGERYIEVIVSDRGTTDDVLARHDEWHRRVSRLPAIVKRLFRLSVDVHTE